MNNFCAVGRLTSSPEYKKTPNGTSVVRFTLAVERQFKDKDGNKITDFIPCQAWRQTADFMQQYINKGDMVSITGELHSEKYNDKQSGQQRIRYSVVCSAVKSIKKAETQQPTAQYQQPTQYQQQRPQYQQQRPQYQQNNNGQRQGYPQYPNDIFINDSDGDRPF